MIINRNNYEQYVLDYLEGRLDEKVMVLMKSFLSENPDIEEEVSIYDPSMQFNSGSASVNKTSLFHSFDDISFIGPENFEEFCVAYYEGDLTSKSSTMLKRYLQQNPELKPMYKLHAKLKFTPDKHVHYSFKKTLKKDVIIPVQRRIYYAITAAAAIFLLFMFFQLFYLNKPGTELSNGTDPNNTTVTAFTQSENKPSRDYNQSITHTVGINRIIQKNHPLPATGLNETIHHENVMLSLIHPVAPSIESIVAGPAYRTNIITAITIDSVSINKNRIADNLAKEKNDRPTKALQHKLFWSVLHLSIKGINSLTENNLALHTEQNSSGELTAFALENKNFEISKRINKNVQN